MTSISQSPPLDPQRVEAFLGQVLTDLGATTNTALVRIGDALGLYRAMADGVPVTAAALAESTGTAERYVREWLNAQAAGGYVTYDPALGTYALPAEHAAVLAHEDSPVFMVPAFQSALAATGIVGELTEAFRSGAGVGYHRHDPDLFDATARGFGTVYRTHLTSTWIPAAGVEDRLRAGASVADVGCGHGVSTILMAQAHPDSQFLGIDCHEPSVERARQAAARAGVGDRVAFEAMPAADLPRRGFDLITVLYALHDTGDPVGTLRRALEALAGDGVVLLVEPRAGDRVEDNLHPAGRFSYGMSTLICTPGSLSQPPGHALGHQAGPAALREVVTEAGFTRFEQVDETPAEAVYAARP